MVNTIKFSEFTDGGDLENGVTTVGLSSGTNTKFDNPWTFLASGSTGERPIPNPDMYYRLRFNTTLQVYEYYDADNAVWAQLSGSGTGTVNPGSTNDLVFYAADGQTVSPIAGAASSVLITNGSKVPSLSSTLPTGLSIPGATITASTAALTSGQVAAVPTNPTDITNKTYVDTLVSAGVTSITGTANQVIANNPTGAVTLSLPQDIAPGSSPSFIGITLTSTPLSGASGGTGVNNSGKTITLGGNLVTSGAFASTFTMTGITTVTFPTSGTLATTSQIPTGAALTKTDDTNVTLTLGGSPTTALVNAASLTLGWSGLLAKTRGGTGVSSVTTSPTASEFAGWDANSNLSANVFKPNFATTVTAAGTTTLTVASAQTQEFTGSTTQTVVMPDVSTLGTGFPFTIINNSSGNLTVNSSGGNLILTMASNTTAFFNTVLNTGTTASSWNASYVFDSGAGVLSITGTANQVIASASTGNITLSLPQNIATTSTPIFAGFNDTNNVAAIRIGTTASAVNYISMTNASTGNSPTISATGSDPNIILRVQSAGTGAVRLASASTSTPITFATGTSYQHSTFFSIANTAASQTITIPDATFTMAGTSLALGGTNANLTASNGGIVYSTASAMAILSGTATARQMLQSGASTTPAWSTTTWPATSTINRILYSSAANVISEITTANSSILVTDSGGVPSLSTTLPAFTTSSITFSPTTGGIVGTTTNDNAAAGKVGEFISSVIALSSAVSLTSPNTSNVTSISLTAGDWDVWGNVFITFSALGSLGRCWISSTSATPPDNSLIAYVGTSPAGNVNTGLAAPQQRFSLSGTTTVYLSCSATFASGTGTACGGIYARRVR